VVQHVVRLKLRRVGNKIVIEGVLPDRDIGIGNHAAQADRLPVPGARINVLSWNRHKILPLILFGNDSSIDKAALHTFTRF
jgi:hypothetical protein